MIGLESVMVFFCEWNVTRVSNGWFDLEYNNHYFSDLHNMSDCYVVQNHPLILGGTVEVPKRTKRTFTIFSGVTFFLGRIIFLEKIHIRSNIWRLLGLCLGREWQTNECFVSRVKTPLINLLSPPNATSKHSQFREAFFTINFLGKSSDRRAWD